MNTAIKRIACGERIDLVVVFFRFRVLVLTLTATLDTSNIKKLLFQIDDVSL